MRSAAQHVRSERGEGLIGAVLMTGLVLLVVAVGMQALLYVHARSIASGAAQDGARAAASGGAGAGVARAKAVLAASGGTGDGLRPSASSQAGTVTVQVDGHAPNVFPLPGSLAAVHATATLPVEDYPAQERGR